MVNSAKRTLLVIEDNELNREILCEILSPYYRVLQAENGKIGLDMLKENHLEISLILLDLQMPIMDGYEFLEAVQQNPYLGNIPIIVTTSRSQVEEEIKCLENGATDFVTKPYNPNVVLKRVESMIRLREASELVNKMEHDALTGLYSKDFFFANADTTLHDNRNVDFDMVCYDVKAFKMINDRYGVKVGNTLLVFIAETLKKHYADGAICGRLWGDKFAVFLPHRDSDCHREITSAVYAEVHQGPIPNVELKAGLYQNITHDMQTSTVFDYTMFAVESIKHLYGTNFAEYNDVMREKRVQEQNIMDSAEEALKTSQFRVYYQAKHNLQQEKTGGAEALVRWIHPEIGFMNPGQFIPLFEQNGFIRKLDYYMVEHVCRDVHEWIQKKMPLVPISLNISRADFDDPDLAQKITNLIDRYGVPHELLHLEVTESAYTDATEQISNGVKALREKGFVIELDDFGSGYSSLNVLGDLDLDVLKLDMSLIRGMKQKKKKFVLKHILSIAHGLNVQVVAEGVETEEQANELREMGCTYAQGYFYSKPIPRADFEAYLQK